MAIPAALKQFKDGSWQALAPETLAECVRLPNGKPLTETEPDSELVTITHNLGGYPLVLLLSLQYGAGVGGAGEGPAGGSDATQYPCRAVYHDTNSLTVYTVPELAALGPGKLQKVSNYEYTLTFEGVESVYVKLVLNMGNSDGTVVQWNLKQVE